MALAAIFTAHAQTGDDETSLPSIPDYFQQNGLSNGHGQDRHTAQESINTFTGKLHYRVVDVFIPGNGGMDLAIGRSYNSIDDPAMTPAKWIQYEYSPVGLGWTMHMGRVLRGAIKGICSTSWAFASANPVLELPDGSRHILYQQSGQSSTWMSKDFWRAQCHNMHLRIQSPDGTTYDMGHMGHMFGEPGSKQRAWYASRITDRNGNWFDLGYQTLLPYGVTALSSITTSDGRAVDFAYSGSTLSSITDTGTGRVWKYTTGSGPGGKNYLQKVQRPDDLTWQYTYRQSSPGTGSLHSVQYPEGGSVQYTYSHVNFKAGTPLNGNSTVVVGKTASTGGGADAPSGTWSWAYQPATQALPIGPNENGNNVYLYTVPPPVPSQVNVTTATDPLGQVTQHFHFGLHSAPQAPQNIGTYMGSASAAEITLFGYHYQTISTQQDVLAHMFYPGNYHPQAFVLAREYRDRPGESFITLRSGFDNWGNPESVVENGSSSDASHTRQTHLTWSVNTAQWRLRQIAGEAVTVNGQTHTTTRNFDGNGNVMSQTAAGVPQTFTWNASGDLASSSNAAGQTTSYTQYHRGIAQNEAQPGGVNITRTVDAAGNITAQTNGQGHTTQFSYDSLGRVTSIKRPIGNAINVAWSANARSVQRGGMTDTLSWDGLGRPMQRTASGANAAPVAITYRHNMLGQRVFQSYPNSAKGTGYRYDMLGRVTQTLHGNTAGTDSADLLETTSRHSLLEVHQDSSGRAMLTFLRAFGNPEETQALRSVAGEMDGSTLYAEYDAQMTRDLLGQLTSVAMDGKTRSYGYDSHHFLTSRTDPETGTTTFGRDAVGNMTSQSINGAPATQYIYDARNRTIAIEYPASEGSNVPQAPDVEYTYDNNDNVTSITNGNIQRHYSYDAGDKLVEEKLKIGSSTQTLKYAFNANEALTGITYPSGHTVQYEPDAFGRATKALPHVTQITWHSNGMPETIRHANGTQVSMPLNARQWPSALKVAKSSTQLIDSEYFYDTTGNLLEIDDNADMQYSRLYGYDAINRLRVEGSVQGWRDFYYDASGSLTWVLHPQGWQSYSYGSASGLLETVTGAAANRSYTYDSAGNATGDGTFTFGYDRASNMRCAHCTAAAPTLHSYDGANMRVQTVENGITTQSLHNRQGLLLQTITPGVERKEYIYLGRRQIAQRRIALD